MEPIINIGWILCNRALNKKYSCIFKSVLIFWKQLNNWFLWWGGGVVKPQLAFTGPARWTRPPHIITYSHMKILIGRCVVVWSTAPKYFGDRTSYNFILRIWPNRIIQFIVINTFEQYNIIVKVSKQ